MIKGYSHVAEFPHNCKYILVKFSKIIFVAALQIINFEIFETETIVLIH